MSKKIVLVLFGFLVLPALAFGAVYKVGEAPSLASGETLRDDLYIFGGSVTSSGEVFGDVMTGGGSVILNSKVGGDVMALGGNVTILGDIADDLRVAVGNIVVSGAVGGDLGVGGGQVHITGTGIKGDILGGTGLLRIDAPVGGNLKIGGGDIFINAPIKGNADIKADKITFGENGKISGDFKYSAKEEVTLTAGQVGGKVDFTKREIKSYDKGGRRGGFGTLVSFWLLSKFIMVLLSALVLGLLLKRYYREVVGGVARRPLYELGRGFLTFAAFPVAIILLLISVIGAPLGVLAIIGFIGLMIFTCLSTPILLGAYLHKFLWKKEVLEVSWLSILVGVVAFFILGLIPLVGWVINFILILMTLGSIARIKLGILKD